LDGVMVGVELEVAAHAFEVGLAQCFGDVKGKPDAFREALRKADFESVRGNFKFNTNHYPIQDWYLVKVERNSDGKLDYKAISTIAKDHTDPYVSQCEMK